MVFFLGFWMDIGGRCFVLLVFFLGSVLEVIIVLFIMYFDWLVFVLFVGLVINGFLGFFIIMNMVVFVYVFDIIIEEGFVIYIG